jgi:hypothetical protein
MTVARSPSARTHLTLAGIALACGFSATLAALSGCRSAAAPPPAQRADYTQTLNKYYEGRPMCIWEESVKFPVENATPEQVEDLGLDGLADAGLVQAKGRPAHGGVRTYILTPEGRSAINKDVLTPGAGNFCYGLRKVVSIDKARRNSSTTELVDFHFSVPSPASWAKENSIQNAFPDVAAELAGPHEAEVTLLDTTSGWEVSGTPSATIPHPARHGSSLERVLHLRRRNG